MGAETSESNLEPNRFDHASHWITRQIDAGIPGVSSNPLLTGVVKFAAMPDLLAGAYVLTRGQHITLPFLGASALFLLWVNIAPYLIWYYDSEVVPQFYTKISEIVVDTEQLDTMAEKYNDYFASFNPVFALLWGGGFLVGGVFSTALFESQGMTGGGRIFLWTTYAYGAYVGAVLGEAGFSAVVTTIRSIREVATLEFDIQPLHPDGLGGLSTVGYYAIRTTILWSTASLLIPMAFRMMSVGGLNWVMSLVTAAYIGTILFSFVYPTMKMNRRSEEIRESILEDIRQEYNARRAAIKSETSEDLPEIKQRLELQQLRSTYEDYKSVRLYPMQTQILARLAGSVILPLIFLVIEQYFPKLIG